MYHELVNRNDDIQRLVKKGYAVAFDANNYLVVRDVPYLDQNGGLHMGAIVSKFEDHGDDKIVQVDHTILFCGSHPCELDGSLIANLGGGVTTLALSAASNDVKVERSFSNKPKTQSGKFDDFFHKIESYVNIISGPAITRHGITPLTCRLVEEGISDSPFKFRDTLTARAEIGDLSARFKGDVIAIIGLGGTGGYLLDFMAKTPVREIRGFDRDPYYVHNAFRSPGKIEASDFGKPKAEVNQARYDNFRTGLTLAAKFIDGSCQEDLHGVTFAFVCVDKGSSRAGIFDLLIEMGIPFIDVGMGLDRRQGPLNGMLRVTYFSPEHAREMRERGLVELADNEDDAYRTNVQIGELNAFNACLAVVRFKQLRGFYCDEANLEHLLFTISDMKVRG